MKCFACTYETDQNNFIKTYGVSNFIKDAPTSRAVHFLACPRCGTIRLHPNEMDFKINPIKDDEVKCGFPKEVTKYLIQKSIEGKWDKAIKAFIDFSCYSFINIANELELYPSQVEYVSKLLVHKGIAHEVVDGYIEQG